jgi:predicted ATPase
VDVRFGPFTCIAGANGVGKSNLFDAIRFLSLTASHPLATAAQRVRDEEGQGSDVRGLFHRAGNHQSKRIRFEAEMIIPDQSQDDLGQTAKATSRFLKYTLEIQLRPTSGATSPQHPLEVIHEELVAARGMVGFPVLRSVRQGSGGVRIVSVAGAFGSLIGSLAVLPPPIITEHRASGALIKLRSEGRRTPVNLATATQPSKTLLSEAAAKGSPSAFCAQRELQSWQLLQLDPAALRQPDSFDAPSHLAANGRHLAAAMARLIDPPPNTLNDSIAAGSSGSRILTRLSNRLAGLVGDIGGIRLDRDEKRSLNTILIQMRDGTEFPARSVSDGTLRLLALALLEQDPESPRLLCLEEPENGIHPDRMPAIVQLLRDIAVDPMEPLDETNLLRQVMVTTHSPSVAMCVPDDSLVLARCVTGTDGDRTFKRAEFAGLAGTWRAGADATAPPISKGELISYLNPAGVLMGDPDIGANDRRVVDRPDAKDLLKD